MKSSVEWIDDAVTCVTGIRAQPWLDSLRTSSQQLQVAADFPIDSIRECAAIETFLRTNATDREWTIPFYLWLASGCLTTAFVMTQRDAARRRIESSRRYHVSIPILESMKRQNAFATVGISHLTTSRRHLAGAPLVATPQAGGWLLHGYSPWVTGAGWADWLVLGAAEQSLPHSSNDGLSPPEMLFAVPSDLEGIEIEPGAALIALTASSTGVVRFNECFVDESHLIHGPILNVMQASGSTGGAGGLHTSSLAIGHAAQAIRFLEKESLARCELIPIVERLSEQQFGLTHQLDSASSVGSNVDSGVIRKSANDLALRATHAALIAAKGTGYLADHEVGRWCQEALFFLVWSCPQSVADAHLCSLMAN